MATAIQTESTVQSTANISIQMVDALADGFQQLVIQHHLKKDLISKHQATVKDLLVSSLHGSPQTPQTPTDTSQPWGWIPGMESPDATVGTLILSKDQDIPLHDHPGSSGLLLILNGRVQIRSYRILGDSKARQQPPLELEMTAEQYLSTGELAHFGPDRNNIHTLRAIADDCVIFDVLFSPYQLQQRSYFMPIVPDTGARQIFVSRLNKLYKNKTRTKQ